MRATPRWQSPAMLATLHRMDLAARILIVDDDDGIRTLISSFLEKHGYQTSVAGNPAERREVLKRQRHDLIVLDVMMPQVDGLTALRNLQAANDSTPVIMLSAAGTDVDRIIGLEIEADDYLAKPCNPRELLARIRPVLRRREARPAGGGAAAEPARGLRFGGWVPDVEAHALRDPEGALVSLRDGEFRLLRAFVEHARRVLTRGQLLDYARGEDSDSYDRAIDVQVSRLRRKLSAGRGGDELIRTVRNEGYMFTAAVTKG